MHVFVILHTFPHAAEKAVAKLCMCKQRPRGYMQPVKIFKFGQPNFKKLNYTLNLFFICPATLFPIPSFPLDSAP